MSTYMSRVDGQVGHNYTNFSSASCMRFYQIKNRSFSTKIDPRIGKKVFKNASFWCKFLMETDDRTLRIFKRRRFRSKFLMMGSISIKNDRFLFINLMASSSRRILNPSPSIFKNEVVAEKSELGSSTRY